MMMDLRSAVVLFLNCAMLLGEASGQRMYNLDVKVTGLHDAYPTGASVPIGLIVTNKSQNGWPLLMSALGTPADLMITVYRTDGFPVGLGWGLNPSKPTNVNPGPRIPPPEDELYKVPPAETILLNYDLAILFALDRAGDYVLELTPTAGGMRLRHEFTLLDPTVILARQEKGMRARLRGIDPISDPSVSCRVSMIEIEHRGRRHRFLRVDDLQRKQLQGYEYKPVRVRAPASVMPTGTEAEFVEVRMDCLSQLSVVLREGSKSSLVLWKMADRTFETLIPPTEQKIELGTTEVDWLFPGQDVVIAGVAGKPKLTTLMPRPVAVDAER